MDCRCLYICNPFGGLAQLARALAWHARGRRFDPDTLHNPISKRWDFLFTLSQLLFSFLLSCTGALPFSTSTVSVVTEYSLG